MARDFLNRAFAPTTPDDLLDPPRFSQIVETTKDVFVLELRKFFANAQQTGERRSELPTIEKYATFGDGNDPFSAAVNILRKLPDTTENLPHVAVMASVGSERKLTIGPPFIATVQNPAEVVSTLAEPFALVDGDALVIRTMLEGNTEHLDVITFTANRFPTANPISAALAVDVAAVINETAAHVKADAVTVGAFTYVRLMAGGYASARRGNLPTEIEVHANSANADTVLGFGRRGAVTDIGGTAPSMTITAPAGAFSAADIGRYVYVSSSDKTYFNDGRFLITAFSTALGTDTLTYTNKYGKVEVGSPATWFIGLRDDHFNPLRPPMHRYGMAFDLNVQLDILCEDENTRGEVVDLVLAFLSFFLESKYFTFLGRSGFSGQTTTSEHYQITLTTPVNNGQEGEFPRPGGDGTGKIYVNSLTVGVTTSMYLDREVYFPGTNTPFVATPITLVEDTSLPLPNAEAPTPE